MNYERDMVKALSSEYRIWRYRIFALTWLVYAGFYLCRKNFSVVMPLLTEEIDYTKEDLAWMIFGYSIIYMIGQFLNGFLSDRFGPRLIVGIGLTVAVLSNIAMAFFVSPLLLFGLLYLVNGYGQSTGWSGTIKNMSAWFTHEERGVVMAWWATCYALGGAIATAIATWAATSETFFPDLGWRRGFLVPSVLLAFIAGAYILLARNRPSDVGLEDIPEPVPHSKSPEAAMHPETTWDVWRAVLSSSALWTSGFMYFFLKMTRYVFLMWLPFYLVEELAYDARSAGYTSIAYEVSGFIGVIVAGYASDKLMGSRRFPVACIMLLGLAGSFFIYPQLGDISLTVNVIGISLIGIMTFGPDALMTSAGAMDIGSQRGAGLAAGFINGMGSAGQVLSPLIVAYGSESKYGWNGIFYMFVVFSLIAAALMASKWNYGKQPAVG